jgi:hypothetical protein
MRRPEENLQRACIQYTRLAYPDLILFAVPNQRGTRAGYEMAILKTLGVTPGVADLIACLPDGRFAAIEMKAPKGRLSDDQEAWLMAVEASNGLSAVVRSVEAYSLILAAWLEPLGMVARCKLMAAADPSKGGFFCLPGEAIP